MKKIIFISYISLFAFLYSFTPFKTPAEIEDILSQSGNTVQATTAGGTSIELIVADTGEESFLKVPAYGMYGIGSITTDDKGNLNLDYDHYELVFTFTLSDGNTAYVTLNLEPTIGVTSADINFHVVFADGSSFVGIVKDFSFDVLLSSTSWEMVSESGDTATLTFDPNSFKFTISQ